MKIHHIGYLVDNIERALSEFEKLGFSRIGETVEDPMREIFIYARPGDAGLSVCGVFDESAYRHS